MSARTSLPLPRLHADVLPATALQRVTRAMRLEPSALALSRPGGNARRLASLRFPALARIAATAKPTPPIGVLPEQETFPLTLDFSKDTVRLPFGAPRFVNAATLLRMANAAKRKPNRTDRLLQHVDGVWEFVADETMIDLHDPTRQFRLGTLTIFS